MAGVVSAWPDPTKPEDDPDKWRLSLAIITRDAHVAPGEVHDRMPAFLTPTATTAGSTGASARTTCSHCSTTSHWRWLPGWSSTRSPVR